MVPKSSAMKPHEAKCQLQENNKGTTCSNDSLRRSNSFMKKRWSNGSSKRNIGFMGRRESNSSVMCKGVEVRMAASGGNE